MAAVLLASAAAAERRVAFVVGNSKYQSVPPLPNPANDAHDIAEKLRALNFDVVTGFDLTFRGWRAAMQEFERKAANSDAAIFYFAGHALQYQGQNYLMPIDAVLKDETNLIYDMISMNDVREVLNRASTRVKIIILDACRNNPLANDFSRTFSGATRGMSSATRGLARIDKAEGMVVVYATLAGEVAEDGKSDRNSPFTSSLLRWMDEPGVEIATLFRRVQGEVETKTARRQRPELHIALATEFYLNTAETDTAAWRRIRDAGDVVAIREFIQKYPRSSHLSDAKFRLDVIEKAMKNSKLQEEAQRILDDKRRADELQRQAAMIEEKVRAELKARADEVRRTEEARRREEQKLAALQAQSQAEQEKARQAAEQRAREEQDRIAAAERAKQLADERARQAAEQKAREDQERIAAAERAKQLADEKARQAAEQKAREEQERIAAAERAKQLADEKARQAAEQKAREDEQRRLAAQQAAEKKARDEEQRRLAAEAKAKQLADEKAREAERQRAAIEKAKQLADEKARQAAEKKAREDEQRRLAAEAKAKQLADEKAREEQQRIAAIEKAKQLADEKARQAAEKKARDDEQRRLAAEAKAKQLADEKAREEQQRIAATEKAKQLADEKARQAAEKKARDDELRRLAAEQKSKRDADERAREEQQRIAAAEKAKQLADENARREQERQRIAALSTGGPGRVAAADTNVNSPEAAALVLRRRELEKAAVAEFGKCNETAGAPKSLAAVKDIESKLAPVVRVQVQQFLIDRGLFQGEANGTFGTTTRSAISKFQSSLGAKPTGFLSFCELRVLQTVKQ